MSKNTREEKIFVKILFVAPRVHPNQVPIIQGFINKGDEVYYCVAHKKNFEKYAGANVFVISPSILHKNYNKYIIKKRGENYAENSSLYKFIPCVKELKNVIRDIKPNLVVIRNRSIFSLYTYIICKQLNIKKVLLYNQTPIYKKKQNISAKKLFNKFAFSLFPKKRITVSRYNDSHTNNDENIKDKNAYFVPFVARKVDSSIKKDYFEKNLVRILDSGKYRDYKNHFLLISLAKVLREQGFSNFRITIQGQVTNNEEQKYYNELLSQIKRENLDEYVELKKALTMIKCKNFSYLMIYLFLLVKRKLLIFRF